MGISIYGKVKGGRSEYSLDMGAATFYMLRCTIARNFSLPFYQCYSRIISLSDEEFNQTANKVIETYKLYTPQWKKRLLDFFFEPDCDGEISYGTAKRIYDLIKNEPDDDKYGYIGWGERCSTMGDFKKLLLDVYCKKGRLCWH